MAAASWRRSMAPLLERRTGPRKVALDADRRAGDALESGARRRERRARRAIAFVRSDGDAGAAARRATPTSRSRR